MSNNSFETVTVSGDKALATWERLKAERRGSPVVLGGQRDRRPLTSLPSASAEDVARVLKAAEIIRHPEGLKQKRVQNEVMAREFFMKLYKEDPSQVPPGFEQILRESEQKTLEEVRAEIERTREPPFGAWPDAPQKMPELSVAYDVLSGRPIRDVDVIVVPTDDWTTLPAYLPWGDWNDCPMPEFHVAAFRSWRDRYGAELVGLSGDVMNLRVARRPATQEEALDLAREQHIYCSDNIDQGAGTLSIQAASLMVSDWWYFWWD